MTTLLGNIFVSNGSGCEGVSVCVSYVSVLCSLPQTLSELQRRRKETAPLGFTMVPAAVMVSCPQDYCSSSFLIYSYAPSASPHVDSVGDKGSGGHGKVHSWALDQGAQGSSWSQGNPREEQ